MMTTVAEKLHRWSVHELNLVSEGGLNKVPDVESLRYLAKGKNKKIWTYVINHVRSQATVETIKKTLFLKKLLKEKEDNVLPFSDNSADVSDLQNSVSRAVEKRMYLMRSLSTIEERILSEEQKVRKINDEIFHINQKIALLELLERRYDEKNSSLKCLLSHISSCTKTLRAHESSKFSDQTTVSLPYGFLYNDSLISSKFNFRFKDVINTTSSIIKMKLTLSSECNDILIENLQNNLQELKEKDITLIDVVILLKEMVDFDMQEFTTLNLQSIPLKEILDKQKSDEVKIFLRSLKYDNVSYSLKNTTNRKKHSQLLNATQAIFKNKAENFKDFNNMDFEVKCTVLAKLAENGALSASNNYLEGYLNTISNKTDVLLRKISEERFHCDELKSSVEKFYGDVDVLYYLLDTASDTFHKIFSDFNNLQSFVHNELFVPQSFSPGEYIKELKRHFSTDRKLMWDFCEKTNLIQPLFTEPYTIDYPLPVEIKKSLNIQSFQSIHTLSENWAQYKKKLQAEVFAHAQMYEINDSTHVLDTYAKFIKLLERMKFSVEKGMIFVNDGMICSSKTKFLIQEWWDQNAQFIPPVEYEGKTLKMWIDILSVLSDFEPVNYVS